MTTEDDFQSISAERAASSAAYPVQTPLDMSHSHSINTISSLHRDYIISEDLLAGQRLDGRMSNVRRFFCLFVTFDFLFTALMWIICVMLNGEYILKALSEQIVHYNVHTSLFDIVFVAFCRFLVLLLFYALIYIKHWIVISISTTLTCMFLTAKVFVFDWPHSSQPAFEVVLVLASFVLSWGEAWFLDFRVLPQELSASRYLISNLDSENAPLIRSYVQGLPSLYTDSVANFYSPQATPDGSLLRFDPSPVRSPDQQFRPAVFSREEEEKYKKLAVKTLQDVWDLLKKDDWKLRERQDSDCIYVRSEPKMGKMYKLIAQINVSPRYLLEDVFYKVEELATWYQAVKESHKIQSLDEYTDITYQVTHEALRGMVSSRDFVNLRHWAMVEDCYIVAMSKTDHPNLPNHKTHTRGENGIGCWMMEPVANEPNKCTLHWILHTNLNIRFVPDSVMDKGTVDTMFMYLRDLRQHLTNVRNNALI